MNAAAQHPDDVAIDRFAAAMKTKMAASRAKGRSGWEDHKQTSPEFLARMLVGHMQKSNPGNFEDLAIICMMMHQRGDAPAHVAAAMHDAIVSATPPFAALAVLQSAICGNLGELEEEFYRNPSSIAKALNIPKDVCCAILRDMRTAGKVDFRKGLMDEDGGLAGCGYRIAEPAA